MTLVKHQGVYLSINCKKIPILVLSFVLERYVYWINVLQFLVLSVFGKKIKFWQVCEQSTNWFSFILYILFLLRFSNITTRKCSGLNPFLRLHQYFENIWSKRKNICSNEGFLNTFNKFGEDCPRLMIIFLTSQTFLKNSNHISLYKINKIVGKQTSIFFKDCYPDRILMKQNNLLFKHLLFSPYKAEIERKLFLIIPLLCINTSTAFICI